MGTYLLQQHRYNDAHLVKRKYLPSIPYTYLVDALVSSTNPKIVPTSKRKIRPNSPPLTFKVNKDGDE